MKEDLLKIIGHFGVIHQLKKLNEECYEFIEAVRDYQEQLALNGYDVEKVDKHFEECVIEEFGDVNVVLEQFKAYFDLRNDLIIDEMKFKIKRTIEEELGNE